MSSASPLRIGYVPEHFSTPLYFAQKHFGLSATLIPFPSGTGHMISSLKAREIDIGIGLTEGWIAALGKQGSKEAGFKLVGTYVESPLCWAINTGANRADLTSVSQLRGSKVGVSRLGSGSHIMSTVLADTQGWLNAPPSAGTGAGAGAGAVTEAPAPAPAAALTPIPFQTFANLRSAVNKKTTASQTPKDAPSSTFRGEEAAAEADFFMWEYFTSRRYYYPTTTTTNTGNAPPPPASDTPTTTTSTTTPMIKKIGEIYTPWPSWQIVASTALLADNTSNPSNPTTQSTTTSSTSTSPSVRAVNDPRILPFLTSLNSGINHFNAHPDEAVEYISTALDYSAQDARDWLDAGVTFANDVTKRAPTQLVRDVVGVLTKAGVLDAVVGVEAEVDVDVDVDDMIAVL